MQQRMQPPKRSTSRSKNRAVTKLGQTTVGENLEVRFERRIDMAGQEVYALMEYWFQHPGEAPEITEIRVWTPEGFHNLIDMISQVLDDIEETGGKNLPVDTTIERPERVIKP